MDVPGNMLPSVLVMPSSESFDDYFVAHGDCLGTNLFVFLIEKSFLRREKYTFHALGLSNFFRSLFLSTKDFLKVSSTRDSRKMPVFLTKAGHYV